MAKKDLTNLVLRAVGLAMGVASVVLQILGQNQPVTFLLGIGLFCLALASFEKQ